MTDRTFDPSELESYFASYRERQTDAAEIEFEDKPGLADQVLTEFSPWRKRCDHDAENGIFHLVIYYPKEDASDMAIRILRFGADVHLVDPECRLALIIKNKLESQMERMSAGMKSDKGRAGTR